MGGLAYIHFSGIVYSGDGCLCSIMYLIAICLQPCGEISRCEGMGALPNHAKWACIGRCVYLGDKITISVTHHCMYVNCVWLVSRGSCIQWLMIALYSECSILMFHSYFKVIFQLFDVKLSLFWLFWSPKCKLPVSTSAFKK